jgi:hypothetical protein
VQDLSLKVLFAGMFLLDLAPGETLAREAIEQGEEDARDDEVTQGRKGEDPGDEVEYGVHAVFVERVAIKVYWEEQEKISKR